MNVTVKVSGPMFRGDPARVVDRAMKQVIIAVAKEGVKEEKAELTPGHGVESGKARQGVSRRTRGMSATVYMRNKMISRWLTDGGSTFKRHTKFRGYDIWTPAYRRTDAKAGEEARRVAAAIVRQLGGR